MIVVAHNIVVMNTNRQLGITETGKGKSAEKLSSGYRINRAADDAAGLSISEKMRKQVRGLDRASMNSSEGISFIQTAEGALNETHSMLQRMRELMVQAANDTNSSTDRDAIQAEVNQLSSELDRVSYTTKYNELNCFSKSGRKPDSLLPPTLTTSDLQSNGDGTFGTKIGSVEITYSFVRSDGTRVTNVDTSSTSTGTQNSFNAQEQLLANDVVAASSFAVDKLQQNFPTLFSNASTAGIKVGLTLSNIDGSPTNGNTLAQASLRLVTEGDKTALKFSMQVDTSDYDPATYSSNSANAKGLRSTVAHEMTHLVMFDTITNRMLNNANAFPVWFKEGMAQTTSGDGGWFSYKLNQSSSDNDIRSYLSQLDSMPYGTGYLACIYLGYAASGSSVVDAVSIRNGLDKVLGELSQNKSLDEVIRDNTTYTSFLGFENAVRSADNEVVDFTKKFITARGTNGAGSLMGELSDTEDQLFGSSTPGSSTNYAIDTSSTWYQNNMDGTMLVPPPAPTPSSTSGGGGGIGNGLILLQVGSESGQQIGLYQFDVSSEALLGGNTLSCSNSDNCGKGMDTLDDAIRRTSAVRSYYGAMQNRLEHTIANLDNISENTSAAESRIRDTDMAKEMVYYSMKAILEQAGQSMLAQASRSNEGVLQLLQ